jgi:predicted ATPase
LAVLVQLGPALINSTERSSPEAGEAADRAVELARRLESSADLARSLGILWNFNLHRGPFERASELAVGLEKIARELDDPEILIEAHHAAWTTDWLRCRLAEGRAHIDAGMALCDADPQAHHRYLYIGHDPAACAFSVDAHFQMLLGYPERAKRCEARAIELARRREHVPSLAQALGQVCEAQVLRRDVPSVIATAKELLELSEEYGIVHQRHNALVFRGWALAQSGAAMDGVALLQEALEFRSRSGARLAETRSLGFIGECLLAAGQYADALEYVGRALQVASEVGELRFVPQQHQLRGELLMRTHGAGSDAAEESLKYAITVARQLGTGNWELRATTSLAQLRADQGRRAEARDLLAPVYGWFTEGFDTPDLQQAKLVLDALG